MTKDEALRLAWDALEDIGDEWGFTSQRTVPKRKEAITAIKEALAESEPNYKKALEVWLDKTEWVQETVKPHELGMHRADVLKQRIEETLAQPEQLREENERLHVESRRLIDRIESIGVPVGVGGFATTTSAQLEQDVGITRYADISVGKIIHNSSPPPRTWTGLTGEEIEASKPTRSNDAVVWELAVEWAEAKLKEKNT